LARGGRESLDADSAFFDRFRSFDPLAEGVLCKKILLCTAAQKAHRAHEKTRACAQIFCRVERKIIFVERKKILISSIFFASSVALARALIAFAHELASTKPRAMRALRRVQNVRHVHVSLSGRLFFSLCCSKRNAVRVDSRPY
jgi:hypothetical protein